MKLSDSKAGIQPSDINEKVFMGLMGKVEMGKVEEEEWIATTLKAGKEAGSMQNQYPNSAPLRC